VQHTQAKPESEAWAVVRDEGIKIKWFRRHLNVPIDIYVDDRLLSCDTGTLTVTAKHLNQLKAW